MRTCANEDCQVEFEPNTHNAIYHSPECRRVVTNKKILAKYYEKKEKIYTDRTCITKDCITILSSYNDEDICEPCKVERLIQRLSSWGWDEEELRDEWRF